MSKQKPISILLVDDQQITRLGLVVTLQNFGDLEVVGEAKSGEEAIKLAAALQPQVALMDIMMPGMNGIEAAKQIKMIAPDVRILMLTSQDHDDDIFAALSAGADGYSLKESPPEQIAAAVRAVNDGISCLDPAIAKRVLNMAKSGPVVQAQGQSQDGKFGLSPRELEVLALVVDGASNQQVAERLYISLDTVKNHMRYILAKLAVADRTQAAVKAMKVGLFRSDVKE